MDPGPAGTGAGQSGAQRARRDAGGRHPHHRDRRAPDQRVDPGPLGQAGPLPGARGQRHRERRWTARRCPTSSSPSSFPASGSRSGLGLSIVYGIVKQNGGGVRVSSEPEQGTTVKVFLPGLERDDESAAANAPRSLRGEETVLVVEDEDGVRELLWKILTDHGHTVLEARHGRDALSVASGYDHPIQLVVTDVVMPEMGAGELVDQLAGEPARAQGALYLGLHQRRDRAARDQPERGRVHSEAVHVGGADAEGAGGAWMKERKRELQQREREVQQRERGMTSVSGKGRRKPSGPGATPLTAYAFAVPAYVCTSRLRFSTTAPASADSAARPFPARHAGTASRLPESTAGCPLAAPGAWPVRSRC